MRRPLLIIATASIALAAPASSQPSAPTSSQPGARTAAAERVDSAAVVREVRRIIAERYVLPERRPALDAVLAEGLSSGRYNVGDPTALAAAINADLERVGRDRHLNFSYNPQQARILGAAQNQGAPDPSGYQRQVRGQNHGVRELRVLPGNVRYMAYDGFAWIGEESAAALNTAMQFLKGGDAVIIDLRRNGGGSPQAVQHLVSHFMAADRSLVTFHMNGQPTPDRLSTLAELPAGRMVGKPLYVLTSNATASAAEEFSGHVAGYRLGELVGENTAGAGFRNDLVPVGNGFILSVSVGRAVLASTGRDWEAVGIPPTIQTPVPGALEVAHGHALRRLAAAAQGPERARLEAVAEGVLARATPGTPALALAAYAGSFGERRVIHENGRLFYQRGERPRLALLPLGGNRFAVEEDPLLRVEFQADGSRALSFDLGPAGGPPQGRYERTGG